MARRCYVTGKKGMSGNNRSHSLHATRRKWKANLQKVKIIDENGEVIVEEDGDEFPVIDPVVTCKNGNNGFGNGDASAPGNSGPNNNANNAGNPDREDCEKKNGNGNNWKFPT